MRDVDPQKARQFALRVVTRLRGAGYQALWAGGCVRDHLLAIEPKDYDVATDALPDQIRALFGRHRTLAIGAAFGVITVLGPEGAGQIEVATFRSDAAYSDGRHPDRVTFSSPQQDAQRRDFTINGLFFDPLRQDVIDYVGGQADLENELVRAIGDPDSRIAEDKLRMLRAVRIAATYGFRVEPGTLAAIERHCGEITQMSAERIAGEMQRILAHPSRARAVELLRETGLLKVILPEAISDPASAVARTGGLDWEATLRALAHLRRASFPSGLAVLLRGAVSEVDDAAVVESVCRRWRLSGHDRKRTAWLLNNERAVRTALTRGWAEIQPLLVAEGADALLDVADALAHGGGESTEGVEFCRQRLAWPQQQLDPPPLITGDDLIRAGLFPGPRFAQVLAAVRAAQLENRIGTQPAALDLAKRLWRGDSER